MTNNREHRLIVVLYADSGKTANDGSETAIYGRGVYNQCVGHNR